MKLTVSGDVKEYKDGISLRALIETEQIEMPEYVTVSVNDDLHSARDFDNITLNDGDNIEFLYFMGGGC